MNLWSKFVEWCGRDTTWGKVTRTVFQGVLGVAAALVPNLLGMCLPPEVTAAMVPCFMAILAAAQSWLGQKGTYMTDGEKDVG